MTTILLICMFIGGCAGSTTCGVKIFRLQVLASTIRVQISRLLRPHGVVIAYYNKRPVSDNVMDAVMGFFYLYILCFVMLAVFLGMTGLDFQTALSGAATSISNVGPGLGEVIGPDSHFGTLPTAAKWAMCFGMILGRLELFTVLVMMHPVSGAVKRTLFLRKYHRWYLGDFASCLAVYQSNRAIYKILFCYDIICWRG